MSNVSMMSHNHNSFIDEVELEIEDEIQFVK